MSPQLIVWSFPDPFMASLWIGSGEGLAIKGFGDGSSRLSSGGSFRSFGQGPSRSNLEIYWMFQFSRKCSVDYVRDVSALSSAGNFQGKSCSKSQDRNRRIQRVTPTCFDQDTPLLEVEVEFHGVVANEVGTSSFHHDRRLGKVLHESIEQPELRKTEKRPKLRSKPWPGTMDCEKLLQAVLESCLSPLVLFPMGVL